MNKYEQAMQLLNETCGNGKDNIIALCTVEGTTPSVRDVDAVYEDGVFYITTTADSNKTKQIEKNPEVAVALCYGRGYSKATAKNLGWVLEPQNEALRAKLRKAFAGWYDEANNEQSKNCVILAVTLTQGSFFDEKTEERFDVDFTNKKMMG